MKIGGKTRLLALLGSPVSHSLSPGMHNAAFSFLGLDYVYLAFETSEDGLERAVEGLRAFGARGFNLTMPHKEAVLPLLDEISPEARMIGSVNTVSNEDGRLVGYNTDGIGFVRDLRERGVPVKGARVVMAGAGGAARSVAVQLALDGVSEIVLLNRTLEKARSITEAIRKHIPGCEARAEELGGERLGRSLARADIFINSTTLGMHPDEDRSVLSDPGALRPGLAVADFIYNPRKTKLLAMAERAGCRAFNGLGMLLYQGAEAFRIWTGREMPVDRVRREVFPDL